MTRTTADWFSILAKRHDANAPRISRLRSYTFASGMLPPLPEMGKNTAASWRAFQQKACLDLGGLIAGSAADRIRYAGVVIGEGNATAEAIVRRVLRDNRWNAVLAEAVHSALVDGESFIMTARDADGHAVITAESAQYTTVSVDPLRPWEPRAAIKTWRDGDEQLDHAYVWDGTYRAHYARPMRDKRKKDSLVTRVSGGAWELIDSVEVGRVPLVVLRPRADGQGCFEPHTTVIDRVHLGILNRLVTSAMQAFRQRAIKGGLPESDEAGNPINWAEIFAPAPGAMWDLPEGLDIWESGDSSAGITAQLQGSKDDLRDLSAVSATPLATLNPEGQNQSAEGAAFAREALIYRVSGYIDRIQPAIELALVRAIGIEDPTALGDDTLTVLFTPPQRISESERMAALAQAKAADVPWRTRMLTIGGFSADEVDRMETERLADQMTLDALLAQPTEAEEPDELE